MKKTVFILSLVAFVGVFSSCSEEKINISNSLVIDDSPFTETDSGETSNGVRPSNNK